MRVLIIGGGLSGLSTAVNLAGSGHNITLIESSPKLGGKAYSFYSPKLQAEVDNGQHLMLGCYTETIKYLNKIKSLEQVEIIDGIQIPFVTKNNGILYLKSTSNIYPVNLFFAFLTFRYLSVKEKIKIAGLFFDILFYKNKSNYNSYEYLLNLGQKDLILKFWEPILISIFNCSLSEISADNLVKILRRVFLSGPDSFKFLIPKVSLNKLFIDEAVSFLKQFDHEIKLSERVMSVITDGKKVTEVKTNKNIYKDFDYVVFAIPTYALSKLFDFPEFNAVKYNPIISTHIKISSGKLSEKYYTIPNSPIQWIFRKDNIISLVTSNPGSLIELNENRLIEIFINELIKYFPQINKQDIIDYVIIKEKRATFIFNEQIETIREKNVLIFNNMFVTGDWTNTGLPSTIESAILSGRRVAEELKRK